MRNNDPIHIDVETKRVLTSAGWREDRDVSAQVETWRRQLAGFPLFDSAREALRRFGGLRVEQRGPGAECAREDFVIDPALAHGEEDRFLECSRLLQVRLFPLGEAGNGHVFLAIAEDGRVFALMEEVWLLGDTIETALDALIQGRSPTRVAG